MTGETPDLAAIRATHFLAKRLVSNGERIIEFCWTCQTGFPCKVLALCDAFVAQAEQLARAVSQRNDAYDVILQTLANLSPHGPLTADDRALFERVRVAVHEYAASAPPEPAS